MEKDPGAVKIVAVIGNSVAREADEAEAEAFRRGIRLTRSDPLTGNAEILVPAPPWVREGWGCDPRGVGDGRFLAPEAPDGWAYDRETGTFYRLGENAVRLGSEQGGRIIECTL